MIRPIDLQDDDLWNLFQACKTGDLASVNALAARRPELVRQEYNYTPPLHFAVREGHLPIVRFLVEHGVPVATYRSYPFQESFVTIAQDREHQDVAEYLLDILSKRFPVTNDISGFFDAVKRGDLAEIQSQLSHLPALARGSNDTGETALHLAAAACHLNVVNALLDAGANADAVRADGRRPIHCALDPRNNPPLRAGVIAGTLLSRGAAYNIYMAAVLGDMEFVKHSLAREPALANFEDTCHQRPISAAARRSDLSMVKLLLDHGADPSLPEEGAPLGQALWIAVYQRQTEMARLLLERGANPNTAPESSGPALLHARKHPELKRLLLQYGAHNDSSDRKRLQDLITDNELAKVEKLLKKKPALIDDGFAFWGEGILAGPANRGNREMIELLIRNGARVPDVTKWGPEYYFKHLEIAALLLDRGMNPHHMNWHRFTLLHHMAAKGDLAKAKLLIDYGADINAVDEEYRSTPLGCAARCGHLEMAAYLLNCGVNPTKADAPWAAPIAWARKNGHRQMESLIAGSLASPAHINVKSRS